MNVIDDDYEYKNIRNTKSFIYTIQNLIIIIKNSQSFTTCYSVKGHIRQMRGINKAEDEGIGMVH